MRMLSDDSSLAGGGGGVDQGSSSATPATPLSAWAVAASQGQLTPAGTRSGTTGTGLLLILAALLCALVGGFSFHSLLRCALHYCGRRRSGGALPPAGAGLKRSAIRRMPVAVYEAEAPGGAPAGAECAICLGEFADGDAVRLLPRCRHGFHVRCIDTWLSAHSSCPICRDSLLDDDEGAAAGEETVAGEGT